jgi:PQQ-dependent catabolism-associated CXXCW motif protein
MRALLWVLIACFPAPVIANEDIDYGLAPVSALRTADYHAPTPREVPGAKTIGTSALRDSLQAHPQPLLFDVLGGEAHVSLPGAIWLPGAGRGQSFTDTVQARFAQTLQALTKGDRKRPLVFFCQGPQCWLSYNAALRAVALGYEAVFWYRGGIEAWSAAGGDLVPLKLTWRSPPE